MSGADTILDRPQRHHADPVLWERYKKEGDPQAREGLILHYSPLVKFVAGRVSTMLSPNVDFGDLVQSGLFGLMDAIEKYEPERGNRFESYAVHRIRGAIIDELRALDWAPRSVRAREREMAQARAELENELQRQPTEAEIADRLEVPVEQLHRHQAESSNTQVMALDETLDPSQGAATLGEMLEDTREAAPGDDLDREETRIVLGEAIGKLPDRERLVITLYYFEGRTLAEIGAGLGVTESRACQIHARALASIGNRTRSALGLL